jgi:crotonobetainyl-CoA:carnitine CoA-transferase CaiB-like acyl-CoA transferase
MEGEPQRALPLRGIRVLDLGMVWAGPQAAALLADFGADVVKVEGPRHPDPFRSMFGAADPGLFPADEILEWSPLFCSLNRNKRGIAVDLHDPAGVETVRRLAAVADVVLDNFSVRVLPGLGLDYPRLRAANPRLVSCSMSGFGRSGPLRDAITYGPMVEQLSGALALSGYPDTGPVGLASAFDAIAGCYSALAIVAALLNRARAGHAADIDFAQTEVGAAAMGAHVADRQLSQPPYVRDGNADPQRAPHRMYPCAGADRWVAISVADDAAFGRLAEAAGHPEWARDPRFATGAERKRHEADLDTRIAAWTSTASPDAVADALQRHSVVAAPLRSVREAMTEPRLRAAGAFVRVDRVPNGRRAYQAPLPVIDGDRLAIRRPAPRLGEHTDAVLTEWLSPGTAQPRPAGNDLERGGGEPNLPPLQGIRVLLRGRSDGAAMAARLLCDLGAAVWRDPRAADADAVRTPGARLFLGAGMGADRGDAAPQVVVSDGDDLDAALAIPGVRVVAAVDDIAGGWRLDDLTACALSSLSWRIGEPGREPLEPGRGYPSAVAGAVIALGIVALLLDEMGGAGGGPAPPWPRTIRVSLLECALAIGTFDTAVVSYGGEPPSRDRRPWPTITFRCRDGWVGLFPRNDEMWEALCAMTDRVDLLADPHFATFLDRQRQTALILAAMAPWFAEHTTVEADEAARALRVPLAIVCDPLDVLGLPQMQSRRMFLPVATESGQEVLLPGLPFLLDGVRLGAGQAVDATVAETAGGKTD